MDKIPITILLFLLVIFLPTNDFVIEKWEIQNNQTELLAQSPILATEKDRIEQKLSVIRDEVEEVKEAIKVIWKEKYNTALAIAKCESGLNSNAVGDFGQSIGLFQVHLPAHPQYNKADLMNVWYNVSVAKKIYDDSGDFSPWKICAKQELGLVF